VTKSLVYNIPARLIDAYVGKNVIVRSASPSELVYCFWRAEPNTIRFMQLLSTTEDTEVLENVAQAVPVEIVINDPATEFQRLYNYATLLDNHPVRVSLPVVPGFSKAAKLAVSLNYAVKLEMEQPDAELLREVQELLDLYLHRSHVRQPIEFFHSLLLSFYRDEPVTIWQIAEEDPDIVRYINDQGDERISKRFDSIDVPQVLDAFVNRFASYQVAEKRECHNCEFFGRCSGYFKWPEPAYSCDGIKQIFRTLRSAADEMKHDLANFEAMGAKA
jgi:sulfatase maturation enzyme AslB (radical SAM superfamily)